MPVLVVSTPAALMAHALSVCEGDEVFGEHGSESILARMTNLKINGNHYILAVKADGGTPGAIVAYPRWTRNFRYGLLRRVLTLDNEVNSFPTFVLTHDGRLYRSHLTEFGGERVPQADLVESLGDQRQWFLNKELPIEPPCRPQASIKSKLMGKP